MIETTENIAPSVVPRSKLEPGRRVGNYEIVEVAGAGGMGTVYRAHDSQLGRQVAIKVLHRAAIPSSALLAEAQAMARIAHPNVVTVYEAGTVDEQAYVAMEFVDGRTVREWLAAEPRTWRQVLGVYLDAGRGLAAAHAAGIVHRDFKPDNVLIDKDGRVRVTDFGLAGASPDGDATEVPDPNTPAHHFSLAAAGTPAYMAPEQHRREAIDATADQFAFCVALFEGLYGERPFAGSDLAELRRNVLAHQLVHPKRRATVPPWVRAVVVRGLGPDPTSRFPSLEALLAALERDPAARRRRVGLGLLVVATSGLALAGFLRRPEAPAPCDGASAALARVWDPSTREALRHAFLATGKVSAAETAGRVVARLDDYAAGWSTMRRDTCLATEVRREQSPALMDLRMACLDRGLGSFGELVGVLRARVSERAVQAVDGLEGLEGCADPDALTSAAPPPHSPAERAAVAALRTRIDAANVRRLAGEVKASRELVGPIVDEARRGAYDPVLAEALWTAAKIGLAQSDYAFAEQVTREAIQAAARAGDDAVAAQSWEMLIYSLLKLSRVPEALAMIPAADAATTRAGAPPKIQARWLSTKGVLFDEAGRIDDALAAAQASVAVMERAVPESIDLSISLNNLGTVLETHGKIDDAEKVYRRSLAMSERLLGASHPYNASKLNNLGNVLKFQGRLGEALAIYGRALAICLDAFGADHPNTARVWNNLSGVHGDAGRYDEAIATAEHALAIREKTLGPDHSETATALINLSEYHRQLGHLDQALELGRRAVLVRERAHGPDHVKVAEALRCLGMAAMAAGRRAEARVALTRALAIRERVLGAEHPDVAHTLDALGDLLLLEGKPGPALEHYQRSATLWRRSRGDGSPAQAPALHGIARALMALGRRAEAVEPAQRAVSVLEHGEGDGRDLAEARGTLARAMQR